MRKGQPTILLTGATGRLGQALVPKLSRKGFKLILQVRAETKGRGVQRIQELWDKDLLAQLEVLTADLTKPGLGLSKEEYNVLSTSLGGILHAAASTRFDLPIQEARRNNFETTANLIKFAKDCPHLSCFAHISTAFVAGKRKGIILEEEFEHNEGFLNSYEQSKYEAEAKIREEAESGKLPIIIIRPSLIIFPNSHRKGPVNPVSLIIFLAQRGLIPVLPGGLSDKLDLISSEDAGEAVIELLSRAFRDETLLVRTYQVVSGMESPTLHDILSLAEKVSRKKIPVRFCGDINSYNDELERVSKLRPDLRLIYRKIGSFIDELAYPKIFDNRNLKGALNKFEIRNPAIGEIEKLLNPSWANVF